MKLVNELVALRCTHNSFLILRDWQNLVDFIDDFFGITLLSCMFYFHSEKPEIFFKCMTQNRIENRDCIFALHRFYANKHLATLCYFR